MTNIAAYTIHQRYE